MSEGDKAKCRLKCLISLKNQYGSLCAQKAQNSSDGAVDEKMDKSAEFVELVEYIEDVWKMELCCLSSLRCPRSTSRGFKILELKRP